jgi:hypothetical protein
LRKNEFTYNPELILTSDFNPEEIEFDGIRIGQTSNELSNKNITEFHNSEDNQTDDIKNGWILTTVGIQYVLNDGIIKYVRIKKNGLNILAEFDKNVVEEKIGKANKIKNDGIMWVWDYVVEAKVHHYRKKRLKIHYSTENGKICELEIG